MFLRIEVVKVMAKKLKLDGRELAGILLFFSTFCYFLVLASFDCTDAGWLHSTLDNNTVSNVCGVFGAFLADFSLSFLGLAAFVLPLIIFWQGYLLLMTKTRESSFYAAFAMMCLRCLAITTAIMSASAFCYLYILNSWIALPRNSGGILGQELGEWLILQWGNVGAGYIVTGVFLLSMTIFGRISWLKVVENIGKYTLYSSAYLYDEVLFLFSGSSAVTTKNTTPTSVTTATMADKPKAPRYQQPLINPSKIPVTA